MIDIGSIKTHSIDIEPVKVVCAPKYLDGKRVQLMDIYYNGVGVIRGLSPEEMEDAFQEHVQNRGLNTTKTA